MDEYQSVHNIYFILPNGSAATAGHYTPQTLIPNKCTVKLIRAIIINALPSYPNGHSIEFFSTQIERRNGWYVSDQTGWPILLDWQWNKTVNIGNECSIVVSVKALDQTTGFLVPIDPFPSPACPPKLFMWNSSCI